MPTLHVAHAGGPLVGNILQAQVSDNPPKGWGMPQTKVNQLSPPPCSRKAPSI